MPNLKNICLAVSLPVIAFLTFYFYRQKKITNICKKDDKTIKNEDNQVNLESDQDSKNKLENNTNSKNKLENDQINIKDLALEELIIKKSIKETNESIEIDRSIKETNESIEIDRSIKETNQSINNTNQLIKEINLNNNNNFECKLDQDRDISFIIEKNSVKENESLIKEVEQIKEDNQLISNENSIDDSRKISKLIDKFNNESTRLLNQSKEKLNESLNQSDDELNRSINSLNQSKDESIGLVKSIINRINESTEELNINSQNKSANQSKIINQKSNSLEEGEEIFETNNDKSIDRLDKTLNDDTNKSNCNSINDSAQHITQNSTNLTFDTACDSSLNKTIDTTANGTIDTLLDQNAFNSLNYLNQTLLSNDDNCTKDKHLNEQYSNDNSNNIKINENKEEVKEDLNLIEEIAANKTITENILDNSQLLNSTTLNNSTGLVKDDVNSETQIIYKQNDIANKNEDEKFLNVTEDEFKNDSKLEVVNEILEDLKSKIEEQKNLEDNLEVNENLNKSEDDSICCVFDSNELKNCKSEPIETEIQSKEETKTNESNNSINLNESNDSDVVFVCSKPVTTQTNGQTNGHSNNKTIKNDKKLINQKSNENDQISEYCFEIAQALTGLLVGTKGSFINSTMAKSNTTIKVQNHPTLEGLNLCLIRGTKKNINDALLIIRNRFPIRKFPHLTLEQIDPTIAFIEPVPESSQLCLPEGVRIEVGISQILTPNHIFLHQITHPSFNLLLNLKTLMNSIYQFNDTPRIDHVYIGLIAAVEFDGDWYRATVTDINQENCQVKLLDYGKQFTVNKNSLRQVCKEVMTPISIQFQACEAILSNIEPIDGNWSKESVDFFKKITDNKMLQSFIVGYTENGIPKIHLIRFEDNKAIIINEELVVNNFAIWID